MDSRPGWKGAFSLKAPAIASDALVYEPDQYSEEDEEVEFAYATAFKVFLALYLSTHCSKTRALETLVKIRRLVK
jgi:hypothetical protein